MPETGCPTIFDSVVKINNNTELSYSLNVSGSTTLVDTTASTLNVTGVTSIGGSLNITGATTLVSSLNVSGSTTLADTTASTLNVSGSTTLSDTTASSLNVTGATTLESTLSVDTINEKTGNNGVVIESVTLKDGNLQGSTITATNFNVGSRNIISGSAQGSFTDLELKNNNGVKLLIDGDTGDIQGYGTLNITGATTLESTLSVDTINEKTGNNGVVIESVTLKDGNLQGSTITATNFNVGSRNIISGSAQGSFTDLELKNNNGVKLLIDGDTGDIQGYGTLNITGATTLASTLNVSGATTLSDTTASSLNVTGTTTLANTTASSLNVIGSTTLSDTTANSLNVTGTTTLANTTASSLNVSGSTTLSDTTASSLNVTGTTDTIINNFTIKNDGELDPGTTGLSINNIDNIGALSDYKTLLYNNNTKQVRWTNTSSSSSSDALTIDTTGVPTLTTNNTGKYYVKTTGSTQELRFRIKTGISAYQDLLIGTYDIIEPTIVLPEGTSVIKTVNSTFNDTINVTDAGITETITFGTATYSYNTDISTTFGTIRANLIDSTSNSQTSIDMSTVNTYTINYIATDNSGNIKEVVRTLNITANINFYHNYYNLNSSINSDYGIINGNLVGYAVAMNTTGNYLAYSKNNSNKIVIKKETENVWSIYGDYITTTNIQTIVNIQFDNNGNKLLFNDIPSTGNSKLYIYTNNGSDFNNLLQTIQLNYLITNDVNNHNSISISGDGNIILVSESSGYICIYKLDQTSNQYVKQPQTMGYGTSNFGFSTSIDDLGNKFIIGAPLHDADNGKICLYNFSNNDYSTIPTPTEFTFSTVGLTSGYNKIGYDVSISNTGRFAFSAPFANENSKTYSGCVFIYENDNTLLTKINGYDNYMGFGTKIELSKNGRVITITARDSYNNNSSTSTGFIKMYYEYQEKTATTDSVWLEIDHKNIYSATSDVDIYFGYSSALDYSGTKLLVGSPNYDIDTYISVGNINLYEYTETDAKIYNSWDLYLKDKTTAESGLNINDLSNIEVYFAGDKNNPHIASTDNNNLKFTQNNTDSTLDSIRPMVDFFGRFTHGLGLFGKFDNQKANSRTGDKFIINSPNYKEYLSGSVNGDIFIHPPSNPASANVIKIPIIESGNYVIYNSFFWPFGSNAEPAAIKFYIGNDTFVTTIIERQFNVITIQDINNSYKNFLKYYSGDNGSATNYDTINGLELGDLTGNSDNIYISATNEGNWADEYGILRFQIAKRPTAIPTDYKHIVTIYKNQPVCNPWNGTAIDELAPTVYNPLVTYSKYKGRDLEIKLDVTLEDDTIETFYFAGWRLDEVFNFYLKNGANTLGKVFAKSSLSNNTWFTADNVSSYKLSDGKWQWSFTDEDNNSATTDTGFGYRSDSGINNVGVIIGSNGAGENVQKLWTRTNFNSDGALIKNINVSMKKAGIMAVPNGGFETTIIEGDTYNDQSITLYEWDTTTEEYQAIIPESITSSFSPTLDTNTAGAYIQTYIANYNSVNYTTKRILTVNSSSLSTTSYTLVTEYTQHGLPVNNPWNGTGESGAPTVVNPINRFSDVSGTDIEVKITINNSEICYFKNWRLDEVFNYNGPTGYGETRTLYVKSPRTNNNWIAVSGRTYRESSMWIWIFSDGKNGTVGWGNESNRRGLVFHDYNPSTRNIHTIRGAFGNEGFIYSSFKIEMRAASFTYSITSDTTRHYNPVVLRDGVSIFTFVDSDWNTGHVQRGLAFVIIDITTLQKIETFTLDTYQTINSGIENPVLASWLNNLTYNNPNYVIFGTVVDVCYRPGQNPDNTFTAIRNSLGGTISRSNTDYDSSYTIISRFNSTGTATLLDEKIGGNYSQVTASATI